ncbi:PIN domain-containing protein [Roseobacteraceae bacterium NS-SX3]
MRKFVGGRMRNRFPWYFIDENDYDTAWKKGILTVDTNVLLDLYRYNESTREALISALESFKGRLWISHQTSKEFVKNRRVVINDVKNDFVKAQKPVGDVEKALSTAISAIQTCRIIPKGLSEKFSEQVLAACKEIREGIDKEKSGIPNYDREDDILQRLETALNDSIGSQPDDLESDLKEAKRRRSEKIPPGYMDDSKEGMGFAGDYLMWKQILAHCKEKGAPIILVTSETKEDWWEKKSGRTLNPRLELLQEAFETTGQKILIYHTDQFLRLHQERAGTDTDETALEEIREYSLAREPAVSVKQEVESADAISSKGILRVSIARPVRNFTSTGRFSHEMLESPKVIAKLVDSPSESPDVSIRSNTGTTFDFNVHVHSNDRNSELPIGEYLLEYEAYCEALNAGTDGT